MNKTIPLFYIPLTLVMILGLTSFPTIAAEEYVPKAEKTVLHQAPLPDSEGKEMTVIHLAIPPGFVGGKHRHPGPVFVYVLEGVLTLELGGKTKSFKAGELYAEEIDTAMVAKNLSTSGDLDILVFQVGDIGKPMMIKVK